jgi:hypothetical protein
MNNSHLRPPRSGFEGRLEAELVSVVTERATRPQSRPALRRPAMVAGLAATAAATGIALGVPALTHGPAGARVRTGPGAVHIRTAGFTLERYTDGTLHVTWPKDQYFTDHAGLQQALRAAGFPVLVREGVFCQGPSQSGQLDPSGVGPGVSQVMRGVRQADGDVTFIFTPSAMPAGEELFIGYLTPAQLAVTHGRPGSVERLVPTGVPLTCTTQAPPPK